MPVNKKISELVATTPLLTDLMEVARDANDNLSITIGDLKALIHSAFTMQNGYDNSTAPQIITSTPLGAVDFKRGSAADVDDVLRVLTGGGAPSFSVTGAGDVATTGSTLNIGSGAAGFKALIIQEGIETTGIRFDAGIGAVITSSTAGNTTAIQSDGGVLNATFSGGIGAELLALVGKLTVGSDVGIESDGTDAYFYHTGAGAFATNYAMRATATSTAISTPGTLLTLRVDNVSKIVMSATVLRPNTAGLLTLGTSGIPWGDIHTNGTIFGGNLPFDIGVFFPGVPLDSELLLQYVFSRSVDFVDDFVGSEGSVGTNPTSAATIDVQKNASSIGTISITTGGVVTFVTAGGATSFVTGDTLELVNQGTADATMADISITLKGTRA